VTLFIALAAAAGAGCVAADGGHRSAILVRHPGTPRNTRHILQRLLPEIIRRRASLAASRPAEFREGRRSDPRAFAATPRPAVRHWHERERDRPGSVDDGASPPRAPRSPRAARRRDRCRR